MITIFCAAVLIAELCPDIPVGRFLRRWMIELPAARLTQIGLMRCVLFLLVCGMVFGLIAVAKAEGAFVAAQGGPEALAWLASVDGAVYFEFLAAAWLLRANVRFKAVTAALSTRVLRLKLQFRRPYAQRTRAPSAQNGRSSRRRPLIPPRRADDEERPAPVYAFA